MPKSAHTRQEGQNSFIEMRLNSRCNHAISQVHSANPGTARALGHPSPVLHAQGSLTAALLMCGLCSGSSTVRGCTACDCALCLLAPLLATSVLHQLQYNGRPASIQRVSHPVLCVNVCLLTYEHGLVGGGGGGTGPGLLGLRGGVRVCGTWCRSHPSSDLQPCQSRQLPYLRRHARQCVVVQVPAGQR